MAELSELPPIAKVARYRELAHEAMNHAAQLKSVSTRETYLLMAQQWLRLSEALEAEIQRSNG